MTITEILEMGVACLVVHEAGPQSQGPNGEFKYTAVCRSYAEGHVPVPGCAPTAEEAIARAASNWKAKYKPSAPVRVRKRQRAPRRD